MPNIELVIDGRDNSGGALKSAGGGIASIGNIAAGILASGIFTKLASSVVDFGKDVIEKSIGAQNIQAAFEAQLKATGRQADGTAEMVEKYAQQILKTTKYDDEAAKSAATVFLGFQRIGKDVLPQAIQASADLAAKLGIDMPAAAAMVAKALGGDLAEGGIGKLNTAFKLFDKEQLKVVEDMAAAGDQAGAQKLILDALNKTVGGQAVAAGKTFEGSWQRIMNQVDNVKENLGGPLLDALAGVFDQFANTGAFEQFGEVATNVGKGIAALLPNFKQLAGGELIPGPLMKFFESFGAWWKVNGPAIQTQGKKIFDALQKGLAEISVKLQPFIESQLKKFELWFAENGPLIVKVITQIADGFVAALPPVISFFDVIIPWLDMLVDHALNTIEFWMQIFTGDFPGALDTAKKNAINWAKGITETFTKFVNWVMSFFGTNLSKVEKIWGDNLRQMQQAASSIFNIISSGITSKLTEISTSISAGVSGWVNSIVSNVQAFVNAGASLASGLGSAIIAGVSGVGGQLSSFITEWSHKISNAYSVFYNAGVTMVAGIKAAISYNLDSLGEFLKGIIQNAINIALSVLGLPPIGDQKNGAGGSQLAPKSKLKAAGLALGDFAMAGGMGGGGNNISTVSTNSRSTFVNFGTYNGAKQTNGNSLIDRLKR